MGARSCRPQSTQYTGHKPVCGCECHKIRWVAIIDSGEYQMRNGLPLKEGVSCEDKVELGQMTEKEYYAICKYIPGENGSEYPQEVVQYLYDRNNRSDHLNNEEKNKINWTENNKNTKRRGPGDFKYEEQTLDPILIALNSKAIILTRN